MKHLLPRLPLAFILWPISALPAAGSIWNEGSSADIALGEAVSGARAFVSASSPTIGPLARDGWRPESEDRTNAQMLLRYPRSSFLAEALGGGFTPIGWSGEYQKIPERKAAVRNFMNVVENEYAADHKKPINVVCHGHGCALALEALEEMNAKGIRVNKLVSIGAKLSRLRWEGKPNRPPNVAEWVNVYSEAAQRKAGGPGSPEEASAQIGRGIASYCVERPPDVRRPGFSEYFGNSGVREAVAQMVKSDGPAGEVLAQARYRGLFNFARCPVREIAQKPLRPPPKLSQKPPAKQAAADPAPRTEAEYLKGPRKLILGAIDLARSLARQTRDRVERIRADKLLRKEDFLAKKKQEDEERRLRAQGQQPADQYPWDPGPMGMKAPPGHPAAGASAFGSFPSGGGRGRISAFSQGGVRLQDLQPQQPQGGP
ncbi:MAG: hypothetical protein HY922_13375 [Elusimicrobia bacterium]|nr:hypothetical protein [Elusimicrobiota bacterium]